MSRRPEESVGSIAASIDRAGDSMAYIVSQIKHERFPNDVAALKYSRSVEALMHSHMECVAGEGTSTRSCGARRQLMAIAVAAGWSWVGKVPDSGKPC